VRAWWQARDFDLRLRSHEGNCDLCMLKARWKIEAIMRDRPDLAEWWIRQEAKPAPPHVADPSESYRYFRIDREPYARLLDQVRRQGCFDFGARNREVGWDGECSVCTD
jgi:hypothetical protein